MHLLYLVCHFYVLQSKTCQKFIKFYTEEFVLTHTTLMRKLLKRISISSLLDHFLIPFIFLTQLIKKNNDAT